MERGDLSVAEAAKTLGTSPQTVRTLLRNGELRGRKRAWGSRSVWEVNQEGVDEFLAKYGRLDGRRRPVPVPPEEHPPPEIEEPNAETLEVPIAPQATIDTFLEAVEPDRRPFVLRPRGRATVVVLLLGVPLLIAYAVARILPNALWFDELGQLDAFRRVVSAKAEFHLQVLVAVAVVIGTNLALALRGTRVLRSPAGVLAIVAVALVTGNLFASTADAEWQSYLLWRHRQPFGVVDEMSGQDVGFFVFSLPFYLHVSVLLLWLLAVTAVAVVLVSRVRGTLHFRPLRASYGVKVHLAALAAILLLIIAWRLRLERYLLELGQPSTDGSHAFAGAGYVDVNVRAPWLTALAVLALVLAAACLAVPVVARTRYARSGRVLAGIAAAVLVIGVGVVGTLAPALVQRYVVDPNPLLSEQTYLARSIAATRDGLGLDEIRVENYSAGAFRAADFPETRTRLSRVSTWDTWVLGARMRQLVTEPPYFRPEEPTLDVVRSGGRPSLTVVSARELDPSEVGGSSNWINDRLAYTHGLGLIRFSGTDTGPNREPRLLDGGLRVREPRLYFGNLPKDDEVSDEELRILTAESDVDLANSTWVLANTRRPEVDIPVAGGAPVAPYHYDGDGGIALSDWPRRAVFALALGSMDMLLSDDIEPESRLLLHRDVHERLDALAPFIQWDSEAVPLTARGRVVYVVDGYTTSAYYPYGDRVDLGGAEVNYARASVIATVDAFTGAVELYLTDETEPLARAWQEIFPTMFRPISEMPSVLRNRLRYPSDLFDAQATAYERFHTTSPDVFVSQADVWSRPIALSGPLEVAGDVDFDESDEDDLSLTLDPAYVYTNPPAETTPELVLQTFFSPRRGQNLVGSLHGWIDEDGRARLVGRSLPRQPITLGPAQISRIVFATPRVRNLLGLRNLEIRDVDKSSIDSVLLGRPRVLLLPSGVVQIQSLYEGSRGPGAARLLGVTAFLNGRAGPRSGHRERRPAGPERAAEGPRCDASGSTGGRSAGQVDVRGRKRAAGGRHDHLRKRPDPGDATRRFRSGDGHLGAPRSR